ncbi:MAG: electron transport complex subunit RsxE, partial [Pseudomonadota bacterium]|nr:electron transport complex subunit RsxE [Pseudomonadota bacterium]
LLFGPVAESWKWQVFDNYPGFLVAVLPPGAFVVVGFLIAFKNAVDHRLEQRRKSRSTVSVGSKRVRTTGTIS